MATGNTEFAAGSGGNGKKTRYPYVGKTAEAAEAFIRRQTQELETAQKSAVAGTEALLRGVKLPENKAKVETDFRIEGVDEVGVQAAVLKASEQILNRRYASTQFQAQFRHAPSSIIPLDAKTGEYEDRYSTYARLRGSQLKDEANSALRQNLKEITEGLRALQDNSAQTSIKILSLESLRVGSVDETTYRMETSGKGVPSVRGSGVESTGGKIKVSDKILRLALLGVLGFHLDDDGQIIDPPVLDTTKRGEPNLSPPELDGIQCFSRDPESILSYEVRRQIYQSPNNPRIFLAVERGYNVFKTEGVRGDTIYETIIIEDPSNMKNIPSPLIKQRILE